MADLTKELIKQTQAKAYALYRSGLTYDAIAIALGFDRSTVGLYISRAMQEVADEMRLNLDVMRAVQLDRFQYLQERIAAKVREGDYKAVRLALEIEVAKSRALGLGNTTTALEASNDFPFEVEIPAGDVDLSTLDNADEDSAIASASGKCRVQDLDDADLKKLYFESLKFASPKRD